ncbi:ATP-dependent helicase [Spatholobus suberectus]|nr:ATP-dependent helicase [Spatholobus suberectus]
MSQPRKMVRTNGKKEEVPGRGLLDQVFSWSISDILNENLYQNQVKKIPETFSSTSIYMRSFILPLVEETHADLLSSIRTVSKAPISQIISVKKTKKHQIPRDLFYQITVLEKQGGRAYTPAVGDLIAVTNVRPKCINDLNSLCIIAFVHRACNLSITVLSSKLITAQGMDDQNKEILFAVYLTNLTTNMRIWRSLNSELEGGNMKIIDRVLQVHSSDCGTCAECLGKENCNASNLEIRGKIWHSDLNDSQRDAVLSCISLKECHRQNAVKLIWGPPGTGKTKTVSLMLWCLLKLKCRTLTCAPTNVAVLEIVKRVLVQVTKNESPGYGCYGLGDIVLFGNGKRMNIDDHNELHDIFLDYRVHALGTGLGVWKHSLASIISLLEDPQRQFLQYLSKTNEDVIVDCQSQNKKNEQDTTKPWTFEEFLNKTVDSLREQLTFCFMNLCKHLPTSFISQTDVTNTFRALDLLHSISTLLSTQNEGIKQEFYGSKHNESGVGCFSKLRLAIKECLKTLKLLPKKFCVGGSLRDFCLANACLVFCTVSSTAKLHVKGMSPIELLVIDEAAQLKECEATIPLQLCGLRRSILIGDERQLPAMVQSKISEKAELGRSLFERLVQLGHKKHLLNVQHRMHPSISLFPNMEFYKSEILDAQKVKEIGYGTSFFPRMMYSSYSFINVPLGREELDVNHSQRNMIEASVVSEIVKILHEEYVKTNKKMTVGIISPYVAQVCAIEEKVTRHTKVSESGGFEVNVRSVDGFQGGEADVIIISTVRCNKKGSIGFLSDRRRVNVALTRARHCLWILGNGTTLLNSGSVWKKLVIDAKKRGCFYNAQEDKCLAKALLYSLIELNEVNDLHNVHSSLFSNARWEVRFSDEFWHSLRRVGNRETFEQVFYILQKLSNGWRENHKKKMFVDDGVSSQLLEQYEVNGSVSLVWTVDILQENLHCIQVMMVWDILPHCDIYNIAKRLDIVYSNYTNLRIHQCKYRCVQGNVVIPMWWPDEDSSKCSEVEEVPLSKSLDVKEPILKNLLLWKQQLYRWFQKLCGDCN